MPVLIRTEAEANKIRRAIAFCYLCGGDLHGTQFDTEHVIPRGVLGDAPADRTWCPILQVHKKCHGKKNREGEDTAVLWHKVNAATDAESFAGRGFLPNLKSIKPELARLRDPATGEAIHLVKGFGGMYKAVWHWIRGCHTFLYGDFLPPGLKQNVLAPMGEMYIPSGTDKKRKAVNHRSFTDQKVTFTNLLKIARQGRRVDEFDSWGGNLRYMCTWYDGYKGNRAGPTGSSCIWALWYKGLGGFYSSIDIPLFPWIGFYVCLRPPKSRTRVDDLADDRDE